ncbi:MAG TPA: hypothetical protein VEH31_32775 [Streptosporangiaceae bacterium]|nr:hypothetical protein [Streptosporangiaceae bacterium]HYA50605.1 hypothetical protein [Streptosporangiaceae bacterium]
MHPARLWLGSPHEVLAAGSANLTGRATRNLFSRRCSWQLPNWVVMIVSAVTGIVQRQRDLWFRAAISGSRRNR